MELKYILFRLMHTHYKNDNNPVNGKRIAAEQ